LIKELLHKIIRKLKPAKTKKYGWFGNYSTWQSAKTECLGYNNAVILEKVKKSVLKVKNGEAAYERDSVLFDVPQISEPLLDALLASIDNNSLHIVDFGGSLGSSYFQNRKNLQTVTDLKWALVEQAHFVETGKKEIEDNKLKFFLRLTKPLFIVNQTYCLYQALFNILKNLMN
jgi:putative methyltransferase (TIGR04325 family)